MAQRERLVVTTGVRSNVGQRAEVVRRFNRFYTKQIGVLHEGLLQSPFSLTEVRVLYELAHHENIAASELAKDLGLDAGYLSRILRRFEHSGFLDRTPSPTDGRQRQLRLTQQGRDAFAPLDQRSHDEVAALLDKLPATEQERLLDAMRTIEAVFAPPPPRRPPYLLRSLQPGDIGWVVYRHGALYAASTDGMSSSRRWWPDRGEVYFRTSTPNASAAGSPNATARLSARSFWSGNPTRSPSSFVAGRAFARGLAIGTRLVDECIRFARQAGYTTITLWTNDVLRAARRIYEKAGFRLVSEGQHHSFGHDLVGRPGSWRSDALNHQDERTYLAPCRDSAEVAVRQPLCYTRIGMRFTHVSV